MTTIPNILQQIFKGALLIFLGTLVGKGLEFCSRIIIGRVLGPAEFGVFNMGYTVISIGSSLSLLGLSQGVAHFIPYCNVDNRKINKENISVLIIFSFLIVLTSSLIISIILFFLSDFISTKFFHNITLSNFLKVFIWFLPFLCLVQLASAIFRGLKKPKYKVISEDFTKNFISFLLLIIFYIFFKLRLREVALTYIMGSFLAFFLGLIFIYKSIPLNLNESRNFVIFKKMLIYSLPLAFSTILVRFQSQIPIIFLSYFSIAKQVGLYSASVLISQVLSLGLLSINFMLMPIFSELYVSQKFDELKKIYDILTKILIAVFFPISLLLIVYSSVVLKILFGNLYLQASTALKILLLGFIFNVYCGPVGLLTLAIGQSKKYFTYDLIRFFSISLLGFFLIPHYGLIGAALSVTISLIIWNIIALTYIYKTFKLHTFKKENLLFIFISIFLFSLTFFGLKIFLAKFFIMKIILCIGIYIFFSIFLLKKILEKDEIGNFMILKLKQKIGRYNI